MTEKELAKAVGKEPSYLKMIRKGKAKRRDLPVFREGEDFYRLAKVGPGSGTLYTEAGAAKMHAVFGLKVKVPKPVVVEPVDAIEKTITVNAITLEVIEAAVIMPQVETPEEMIMRKIEEKRANVLLRIESGQASNPNITVTGPEIVTVVDQALIDAGSWVPTRVMVRDCPNRTRLGCEINGMKIVVACRPEWKKDMHVGMKLMARLVSGNWITCEPVKAGLSLAP